VKQGEVMGLFRLLAIGIWGTTAHEQGEHGALRQTKKEKKVPINSSAHILS